MGIMHPLAANTFLRLESGYLLSSCLSRIDIQADYILLQGVGFFYFAHETSGPSNEFCHNKRIIMIIVAELRSRALAPHTTKFFSVRSRSIEHSGTVYSVCIQVVSIWACELGSIINGMNTV